MSSSETVVIHPALRGRIAWIDLPLVKVPDPAGHGTLLTAKISDETIHRLYRANRKTGLWQAWGHLAGELPPIPNISIIRGTVPKGGLSGLDLAVACFKGLNRPHRNESDGQSVITYILNPTHTIAMHSSMVCVARVAPAPSNTVLAVYMRPQDALHPPLDGISGIITGWEFIPADADAVSLPEDFSERYGEELWRR